MNKKFALHPGYITSKSDGDQHYIGSAQLARLYELRQSEYVVWDDMNDRRQPQEVWDRYIHLYPSYDGNYGRPDAQG